MIHATKDRVGQLVPKDVYDQSCVEVDEYGVLTLELIQIIRLNCHYFV